MSDTKDDKDPPNEGPKFFATQIISKADNLDLPQPSPRDPFQTHKHNEIIVETHKTQPQTTTNAVQSITPQTVKEGQNEKKSPSISTTNADVSRNIAQEETLKDDQRQVNENPHLFATKLFSRENVSQLRQSTAPKNYETQQSSFKEQNPLNSPERNKTEAIKQKNNPVSPIRQQTNVPATLHESKESEKKVEAPQNNHPKLNSQQIFDQKNDSPNLFATKLLQKLDASVRNPSKSEPVAQKKQSEKPNNVYSKDKIQPPTPSIVPLNPEIITKLAKTPVKDLKPEIKGTLNQPITTSSPNKEKVQERKINENQVIEKADSEKPMLFASKMFSGVEASKPDPSKVPKNYDPQSAFKEKTPLNSLERNKTVEEPKSNPVTPTSEPTVNATLNESKESEKKVPAPAPQNKPPEIKSQQVDNLKENPNLFATQLLSSNPNVSKHEKQLEKRNNVYVNDKIQPPAASITPVNPKTKLTEDTAPIKAFKQESKGTLNPPITTSSPNKEKVQERKVNENQVIEKTNAERPMLFASKMFSGVEVSKPDPSKVPKNETQQNEFKEQKPLNSFSEKKKTEELKSKNDSVSPTRQPTNVPTTLNESKYSEKKIQTAQNNFPEPKAQQTILKDNQPNVKAENVSPNLFASKLLSNLDVSNRITAKPEPVKNDKEPEKTLNVNINDKIQPPAKNITPVETKLAENPAVVKVLENSKPETKKDIQNQPTSKMEKVPEQKINESKVTEKADSEKPTLFASKLFSVQNVSQFPQSTAPKNEKPQQNEFNEKKPLNSPEKNKTEIQPPTTSTVPLNSSINPKLATTPVKDPKPEIKSTLNQPSGLTHTPEKVQERKMNENSVTEKTNGENPMLFASKMFSGVEISKPDSSKVPKNETQQNKFKEQKPLNSHSPEKNKTAEELKTKSYPVNPVTPTSEQTVNATLHESKESEKKVPAPAPQNKPPEIKSQQVDNLKENPNLFASKLLSNNPNASKNEKQPEKPTNDVVHKIQPPATSITPVNPKTKLAEAPIKPIKQESKGVLNQPITNSSSPKEKVQEPKILSKNEKQQEIPSNVFEKDKIQPQAASTVPDKTKLVAAPVNDFKPEMQSTRNQPITSSSLNKEKVQEPKINENQISKEKANGESPNFFVNKIFFSDDNVSTIPLSPIPKNENQTAVKAVEPLKASSVPQSKLLSPSSDIKIEKPEPIKNLLTKTDNQENKSSKTEKVKANLLESDIKNQPTSVISSLSIVKNEMQHGENPSFGTSEIAKPLYQDEENLKGDEIKNKTNDEIPNKPNNFSSGTVILPYVNARANVEDNNGRNKMTPTGDTEVTTTRNKPDKNPRLVASELILKNTETAIGKSPTKIHDSAIIVSDPISKENKIEKNNLSLSKQKDNKPLSKLSDVANLNAKKTELPQGTPSAQRLPNPNPVPPQQPQQQQQAINPQINSNVAPKSSGNVQNNPSFYSQKGANPQFPQNTTPSNSQFPKSQGPSRPPTRPPSRAVSAVHASRARVNKPKKKCCGCCRKKQPDAAGVPKKKCCKCCNCTKETCCNINCLLPWLIFIIGLSLLLAVTLDHCFDMTLTFDDWDLYLALSLILLFSYIYLGLVLFFTLLFIFLMKMGVRAPCFGIVKEVILAIHLIFGGIMAIILYVINRHKLLPMEKSCMKTCLYYVLTMLVLGVLPYVMFSLEYRKIRQKIRPSRPFTSSSYNYYNPYSRNPCQDFYNNNNYTRMNYSSNYSSSYRSSGCSGTSSYRQQPFSNNNNRSVFVNVVSAHLS